MKQQRAVDAVDRDADVRRSEPAHRELGAEVVAGGDAGQHLHRAERIVGDQAAQREQIAAAEHGLARHARLRFAKRAARDRDVLDVGARAFRHRNRDVDRFARDDGDIAPDEAEADDRDEQRLRAGGHVGDLEAAVAHPRTHAGRWIAP